MSTTSRRSWLSAFLLALITPWWPRPAAAKSPPPEEGQSYTYDRTDGFAPAEKEFEVIYTYDHLDRMTQVQYLPPH